MKTRMLVTAAAALMLAPLASDAQSYRCVGQDGKKYYGSTVPRPCIGRPVEELNAHGMVVKRIDPEGSEKERITKEAQEARRREELSAQREVARRNRALLATYTSLKDIDDARARALADNQKGLEEIQGRIDRIRKLQAGYEKELELHKGKGAVPARLTEDLHNAELDLKYQEKMLAAKQRELEHLNEKYSADRKRYAELTGGR